MMRLRPHSHSSPRRGRSLPRRVAPVSGRGARSRIRSAKRKRRSTCPGGGTWPGPRQSAGMSGSWAVMPRNPAHGWALRALWRSAAAMLVWPHKRRMPMARLRKVAMTLPGRRRVLVWAVRLVTAYTVAARPPASRRRTGRQSHGSRCKYSRGKGRGPGRSHS